MIPEDEPDGIAFNPPKCKTEKAKIEWVTPEFLLGIGDVLADSASDKGARGWEETPQNWLSHYGSLQRHLNAWRMGIEYDQESGQSHLLHAACRLMMLYTLQKRGQGLDDRRPVNKEVK
jgi:Domain of unknown function (DUF5664)